MSFIAKQNVKGHTYLYECESYRAKVDGVDKVRSHRKLIGTVDPINGAYRYKPEYVERMRLAGTPIVNDENESQFSVNDIKSSEIKELGTIDFLSKIAQECGLMDSLRMSIPQYADEIFYLASHLVANGDAFMHVSDWLEKIETEKTVSNLSSQAISRILANISSDDVERFFLAWAKKRIETEYLALDITSTSSYSELINDVEWGYNRDGEDLEQINLCLLMGETSRLPVYQTTYQGSVKDVSTLETTLSKFAALTERKPILTVMDKGFYSKKNVGALLNETDKSQKRFIIAVPFSSEFAKRQVIENIDTIESFQNNIIICNDTLRAVTKPYQWGKHDLFAHIYYNPIKAVTEREKLYVKVEEMRKKALLAPEKYAADKSYTKYLNIVEMDGIYTITINERNVMKAYKHAGWLILLSNHTENATDAILIYRAKDIVEKGFLRLKNSLDLGRLRVHSDNAAQSKLFIGFIALVLMMSIHNVMLNKELYKKWTFRELLRVLAKLKVQRIKDVAINFPTSKDFRDIYSAFGFSL